VLLRYGDTDLAGPGDLDHAVQTLAHSPQHIPVVVWRDGQKRSRPLFVAAGTLGVVIADKPAPKAVAEQRRWDRRLASSRGEDSWPPLPGTRLEAQALLHLFADSKPTLLVGSQASEQQLYQLAQRDTLRRYRYLHLATHGEVDNRLPLRSAIILAGDQLPDPGKQLEADLPTFDGRLSAEEVVQQWHLDSDLVTLSACQTALGKYEAGEGFVGFAQALILAGSRSVCLSLWKVDDTATALLMQRFYQNLLGKRPGLQEPMGKAQGLAEAKRWLRQLSLEEAVQRAAQLSQGVARGKHRQLNLLAVQPADKNSRDTKDRPFAHPYYWAAFVLIGQAE
jgi:CHAT domain-containing protein